jgi:hypothetical protein
MLCGDCLSWAETNPGPKDKPFERWIGPWTIPYIMIDGFRIPHTVTTERGWNAMGPSEERRAGRHVYWERWSIDVRAGGCLSVHARLVSPRRTVQLVASQERP